jgi:hypothetical protein
MMIAQELSTPPSESSTHLVLGALGKHPDIPAFEMYTEVIQDSVIRLMKSERVKFRQQLLADREPRNVALGLRQPGMVPLAHPAAAPGDQQQPGSDPAAGHYLHQHRHRSGYLRKRE